ncbi:lipopolysaccharide transport periplasmic protein LptA [Azoarcus sp. DD4]|uniref:lipopolysaccharide transport periplasmic protein LptA n=1 Tax=Azoarcus sp. DD4 TaxID=2027405 RepID=UPI001F0D9E9C|nr:lipopolysaccharide transport periplasmic protein LptA [Azoarcus sp. DD4]
MKTHPSRPQLFAVLLALCVVSPLALAERADRDQPVNIEANKVTVDDRNKVHIFEGDVVLTQGTLVIKGDKLVVTQDASGFQNGVATAAGQRLATFRQKREGSNEYVNGEAERIEYNSRTEKAKLFVRAKVTSGGDEVRGHFIEYDSMSENYLVTNAPGAAPTAASGDGRVRAVIQPKSDNKAGAATDGKP